MKRVELQDLSEEMLTKERKCMQAHSAILSEKLLKHQNKEFGCTAGVSKNNRSAGFSPAYYDSNSDLSVVSRFADGRPAPVHILDGLPSEWVQARDRTGRVMTARPGVIAGFLRDGLFYTREQAARALTGPA